jgi:uncharacterized membrane protein YfcA
VVVTGPPLTELALVATAFVAAIVSGLAGFAFALVAAGVFMRLLPPQTAAAVLIASVIVLQIWPILKLRAAIDWSRLWPFLAAGIVGVPAGLAIVDRIDAGTFRLIVGLFLAGYSLTMMAWSRPVVVAAGRRADAVIGFVGGVMGGMAGFAGAVPTVWCGLRGWNKDEQRAVFQPYILATQALALVGLWLEGAIDRGAVMVFLLCAPGMAAGIWLGLRLYARVDDRLFRRIVLWLLLGSGLTLIAS